jgi:tRNA A-37 threonylcarbamoyl transferase component Bud32
MHQPGPSWLLILLFALGALMILTLLLKIVVGLATVWLTEQRKRRPLLGEPTGLVNDCSVSAAANYAAESSQPRPSSCPVCGASLPQDTPDGLCPQCLMQCVLSNSDHEAPEEEGGTIFHTNLPVPPTPENLAPHFPDLEILALLGQGGMGAVYKARQRKLDRLVALKVLPLEWGKDPAFAERFAREARALARLNHPHVVAVHDFGEAGGHYYLIMEYVDGANLRQVLATGRLQPQQALPIVAQVCDALQYAHEQEIVHRDIKPENILLDKRGRVKIADFGLAKLLRRSRNEFTLTGSRQIMGTLDYMAPEQRTTPQTVDHRADIYSLGVVFYEMLTGELPLGRFAPPSSKVGVDNRLDAVVFRALEREPDQRYQRISAVKAEVESILREDAPQPTAARTLRIAESDLALVQMQTRGPAGALAAVALLILIEACVAAALLDQNGQIQAWIPLSLPILIACAVILTGAFKLARCHGYEWVMIAVILCMLPLGYHFFLSLWVGIWVLRVLKRPEVRAAFALHLQQAQGARPGQKVAPAETAPNKRTPGRVRSFILSAFSLFAERSMLARLPAEEAAAASAVARSDFASPEVPSSLSAPPRVRSGGRFAAWSALGLCLLGLLAWALLRSKGWDDAATEAPRAPNDPGLVGLLVPDVHGLSMTARVPQGQKANFERVLRGVDQEYLELEARHTSRQVDEEDHVHVTITPFAEELSSLETRLWAKMDTVYLANNHKMTPTKSGAHPVGPSDFVRKQLPSGLALFAFGQAKTCIEIWREDGWYHWKVTRECTDGQAECENGSNKELPRQYRRFWQDGPPLGTADQGFTMRMQKTQALKSEPVPYRGDGKR